MNEKEINKLKFMLTSLGRSLQGVWGPGRPVWYLRPSRSAFEGGHQRRHLSGLSEAIWVVKLKNPLCRDSHQFLAGTSIIAFISLRDVAVLISWPTFSFFFWSQRGKNRENVQTAADTTGMDTTERFMICDLWRKIIKLSTFGYFSIF